MHSDFKAESITRIRLFSCLHSHTNPKFEQEMMCSAFFHKISEVQKGAVIRMSLLSIVFQFRAESDVQSVLSHIHTPRLNRNAFSHAYDNLEQEMMCSPIFLPIISV